VFKPNKETGCMIQLNPLLPPPQKKGNPDRETERYQYKTCKNKKEHSFMISRYNLTPLQKEKIEIRTGDQ